MSIRIDNDRLTGASTAQPGEAERVASAGARSSTGSPASAKSQDFLQMSSMAANLMQAGAQQDSNRAVRISQLTAAYANNSYRPDSGAVSGAIVEQWITGASGGGME